MNNDRNIFLNEITSAIKKWEHRTKPIYKGEKLFIHQLDRSNKNDALSDMFSVNGIGHVYLDGSFPLKLHNQECLNSGVLRNSFYPELYMRHTEIDTVSLCYKYSGHFIITAEVCVHGEQPITMLQRTIDTGDKKGIQEVHFDIDLTTLPKNARLFWTATSMKEGSSLYEAGWQTSAPRDSSGRMVVMMRTFGRTKDITKLLTSFCAQAKQGDYDAVLRNTMFLVLDTSTDVTKEDFSELMNSKDINMFVFKGANLGGGGNMSQSLLVLEETLQHAGLEIDELLLLDDDLSISLESLSRHWASTLFRTDSTIFTLPVFTKTNPRKMWEDGAFWGRFMGNETCEKRKVIAPRLLRHNWHFRDFAHIDEMAMPHYPEYSTFIFQSMPYTLFQKLGYPAAFFLRGDDIEFSLRNRAAGGLTFSNPNMTAWHEPAHSYAQEYMSIAHGLVINMAYGQDTAKDFVEFFMERAQAHLSVYDYAGLELYGSVLKDINSKSVFLENNFAVHYLDKFKVFKDLDANFEYIPREVENDMLAQAEKRGTHLASHPFLYMNKEARSDLSYVILHNPHTDSCNAYDPNDADRQKRSAEAAYILFDGVSKFAQDFEAIRKHYLERLKVTNGAEFWKKELTINNKLVTLGKGHRS